MKRKKPKRERQKWVIEQVGCCYCGNHWQAKHPLAVCVQCPDCRKLVGTSLAAQWGLTIEGELQPVSG